MRFREYDVDAIDSYDDTSPVAGHERWLGDGLSPAPGGPPEAPRVAVFGEIRQAGFRDAFCLLVDDDGKLDYQVERGADRVEADRDLALIAAYGLDRLIEDPDSRLHNGLFRAAVWAATTAPTRTETTDLLWAASYDSSSASVGNPPQLARVLPADRRLARALARMLASPVDLAARRDYEQAADLAAVLAGIEPVRLDLTRAKLTATGITAALLGHTDTDREAVVAEITVTGTWPDDGAPAAGDTPIRWHGLDWYPLAAQSVARGW